MNEFVMSYRALYKNKLKDDKSMIWEPETEVYLWLFDPIGLLPTLPTVGHRLKFQEMQGCLRCGNQRRKIM